MALTTLQLQAGAALLRNTGVRVAPALTAAISAYQQLDVIKPIRDTITQGAAVLDPDTIEKLQTLAADTCPALADSVPEGYTTLVPGTDPAGFSGLITVTAQSYLGSGDVSKFAQILSTVVGYCASTNQFINTSVNAETFQANTFDGINNMMSGSLTSVTEATKEFGSDLAALGNLIDLAQIEKLGSPAALVKQLARQGAVTSQLMVELGRGGLPTDAVIAITRSQENISPAVEKIMYRAMTQITGNDLRQVKQILGVTTDNIDTMADLLNPVKIFPKSYQTFSTPTCSGNRGIYCENDTLHDTLAQELPVYAMSGYQQLASIIPPDQALANRALSVSLQQISNITKMQLPCLAKSYSAVETARGLDLVENQPQPITPESTEYFRTQVATGSGINGTIVTTDVLGAASGTGYVEPLTAAVAAIGKLTELGALTELTIIYNNMLTALSGPDPDTVISGLIDAAQTKIDSIMRANPESTASLNADFEAMATHLFREFEYQSQAGLSIANLQPNLVTSIHALISSLPIYAQDVQKGGTAEFLEAVLDSSTSGGQSSIAAMRQSRNHSTLKPCGVGMNDEVSSEPSTAPEKANLKPSSYSADEAKSKIQC
jgi:hypothetical protein